MRATAAIVEAAGEGERHALLQRDGDADAGLVAQVEVEQREVELILVAACLRFGDGFGNNDDLRADFEEQFLGIHRHDGIVLHQ